MKNRKLKGIRRVLFDFDGTLFDTQKLHAEVETMLVLREHGIYADPIDHSEKYAGWPTEKVFQLIVGCDSEEAMRLYGLKWEILFSRSPEAVQLAPLQSLFEELLRRGLTIAIGTASIAAWPRSVLREHDLLQYFPPETLIGGDMVKNGKPHPEIWQRAAGGVSPKACLVVEDAAAGIDGAIAANMRSCLLTPKTHPIAISISSVTDLLLLLSEK